MHSGFLSLLLFPLEGLGGKSGANAGDNVKGGCVGRGVIVG